MNRVQFSGREIPKAEKENPSDSAVSWAIDNTTGDILVSVPQSANRSFDLEFLAGAK